MHITKPCAVEGTLKASITDSGRLALENGQLISSITNPDAPPRAVQPQAKGTLSHTQGCHPGNADAALFQQTSEYTVCSEKTDFFQFE